MSRKSKATVEYFNTKPDFLYNRYRKSGSFCPARGIWPGNSSKQWKKPPKTDCGRPGPGKGGGGLEEPLQRYAGNTSF